MHPNHDKLISLKSWSTKEWLRRSQTHTPCSHGQRVHLNDSGRVHTQACQLPHVREAGKVLGENHQTHKNGNITMESSQKFIDELLKIFESLARSQQQAQTSGFSEDQKVQWDKVIHQEFGTAMGKLLWMAQLRDDLEHPVKELSRSLQPPVSGHQKSHSLAQVCHSDRDFILVMGASASNQESIWHLVANSDCQLCRFRLGRLSKKEVNEWSLVSVFNVNLQSTNRTQASSAHSSTESELHAMTQATVESLAMKNFVQEFSSALSVLRSQHCHSDRFISKKINGFTIWHFASLKAHGTQAFVDSRWGQRRQIGVQKGRDSFQPIRCSHKVCSSLSLGSASSQLNILKVNSESSSARKVKYSQQVQSTSTSSTSTQATPVNLHVRSPSATLMLKQNFVSDSDKL